MPDPDMDEVLEALLSRLDAGVPFDQIVKEAPVEARDLIPLVQLASSFRELTIPSIPPEVKKTQRARIVKMIQKKNRRLWLSAKLDDFFAPLFSRRSLAFVTVAVVMILGLGFFLAGPASARTVRVAGATGTVEASAGSSAGWRAVIAGEQLLQGQRIRTNANSSVTLTFFDGSQTTLGPGTEVTLTHLEGGWGNQLQVEITQQTGTTTHNVRPLNGTESYFRVDTPYAQASVHGTTFAVSINPDGTVKFAVTHGKISVKDASSDLTLEDGQTTTVLPGKALEQPDFINAEEKKPTTPPASRVTASETAEIADAIAPDAAAILTKNDTNRCGQRGNPELDVAVLAQAYQKPVDEISGWFCQGYGYGEVDQAYRLSEDYDMPVSQIFELRHSGLGWGQIKQELEKKAKPGSGNHGNPKKTKEPKPEHPQKPDPQNPNK